MKYLILITFSTIMISCDPQYCTDYTLSNKTNEELLVLFYSFQLDRVDSIEINSQDNSYLEQSCGLSGGPDILDLQVEDSIVILNKQLNVLKKYFPNSSGKNIYNFEYWKENKKKKRDYEYTFEITEEDIKQ